MKTKPDNQSAVETALVAAYESEHPCSNTIVLSSIELTIPLEADVDDDPETRDEVRLRRLDGSYERCLKAGDPDVEEIANSSLLLYHFGHLQPGAYSVEVRIGDAWVLILSGLVLDHDGALLEEESFEKAVDGEAIGSPDEDPLDDEDEDDDPEDDTDEVGCPR